MEQETSIGILTGLYWAMGLGSLIALIGGIGSLNPISIVLLSLVGIMGFVLAFFKHGWHRSLANMHVGWNAGILIVIICCMAGLAWLCWPKVPIIIDSVAVDARTRPGDQVRAIVNVTNQTGKVLEVEEIGTSYLATLPKIPFLKRAVQDKLWGQTLAQLDRSAVRLRLTYFQRGEFNFNRSFGPLTSNQAGLIDQGKAAVYIMEVIRSADTHEPLLEFCSYVSRDERVTMCYEHNKP